MLENIVDGLLENSEKLTITLKSRAGISRRRPVIEDHARAIPAPRVRQISFPGSTAQEAWNFTVLLRIIQLIHGGLIDNTIMTKRDIYYKHPDLFMKQAIVDRYIDDLACTLGISRSRLNVTAAAKGLVSGHFTIYREDGTQVVALSKEGVLVPTIGDGDRLDLAQLRWILIIEKEVSLDEVWRHALIHSGNVPRPYQHHTMGNVGPERPRYDCKKAGSSGRSGTDPSAGQRLP